jgi:hypothetical protein
MERSQEEGQREHEKVSLNRKVSIVRHVKSIAAKYFKSKVSLVDNRDSLVIHIRQEVSISQAYEVKIRQGA